MTPAAEPLGKGLIVAAPASGAGKTTITLGLQRALVERSLRVRGAKCGPDYIDPAFHAAATGSPSTNLDGFAMEEGLLRALAAQIARNSDIVIAEGAMGLFDGARAADRSGAPADIARRLGWPVLLVVDARAAAQSVAAVALGCARYPGAPRIAGVIANRVASPRHAAMVADGFARIDLPLLGQVRADPLLSLPSRHLGLVQAEESDGLESRIAAMAASVAAQCDVDAIVKAAGATADHPSPCLAIRPPGQRIAVAKDAAFSFFYPHLADGWRAAGAEILYFSPLADEAPPAGCDACWLPGGYPELHAARIATNRRFLGGLRAFAANRPVHGECGGYMVLGRTLEDGEGVTHAMAGLLPVDTSFARRRMTLGYRRATLRQATSFAPAGQTLFGHEFHYATILASDGEPMADMADAEGNALPPAGHRSGQVTGSFFHLIA